MSFKTRGWLLRYGGAVLAVVLATGLRALLDPILEDRAPLPAFYLAVLLAAWYGGIGPSIVALVLGIVAADYYFVPPRDAFFAYQPEHLTELALYAGVGVGFAILSGALQELRRRAQARSEELAAIEERTRAIVEHVIDGIITIDAKGIVQSFNPAAEKVFGYRADEVIGNSVSMLMPEPDRSQHDRYIEDYVRTGHARIIGIGREVVGRRKNGMTFPMDLAINEFRIGERRFFVGMVRDITQRKQAEEEARQASRRKDEFLAMLAHELRNPLAPIRNGLDLMAMPGVDEETVRWARGVMKEQMEHLVRLVDDLLDVSRITRGKIVLHPQTSDLSTLVTRGVETARPFIESRGHELAISLPKEPVWLKADPIRLTQIIANLLNNAAKYHDKVGHIWLTARREGEEAVIRVRDDGIGIAPDLLPRIFDLFTQADRSLERSQGGLGIGLTLTRSLVQMHGGTIRAFSEGEGKGSELVVRLPALPEAASGEVVSSPRDSSACPVVPPMRLLVVDDNVATATTIGRIARQWGHEVQLVHDGVAALDRAATFHPDAILLDIGLPGMNGYDVARRLRAQPEYEKTLLIAITGYGQEEDRRRSREAGFDHHLVKPVATTTLCRLLAGSHLPNAR